jgi:two-component system, LytTR family, response regulator
MIRVLVAENEPGSRREIVAMLAAETDCEIVGMPASGPETVEAVHQLAPELVFLDADLPGLDGFEVISAIGIDRMPPTIVIAAYDAYAVQAFTVRAVDYLLKPLDRMRLRQALAHARRVIEDDHAGTLARRLLSLVHDLPQAPLPSRFVVRSRGRNVLVDATQIDWIEADGNYVRLHVGREDLLLRATMGEVEQRLSREGFVRIHRTAIVRTDRIKELRLAPGGDYEVILATGRRLRLGRRYKDAVRARLASAL